MGVTAGADGWDAALLPMGIPNIVCFIDMGAVAGADFNGAPQWEQLSLAGALD